MKWYSWTVVFILEVFFIETLPAQGMVDITVGFTADSFTDVDLRDANSALQIWVNEVCEVINRDSDIEYVPKAKIYYSFSELVNDVKRGEVDIVSFNALDYLTMKDKQLLEPALLAGNSDDPGEEFVLLVRKSAHADSFAALRNKKVLIPAGIPAPIIKMWLGTLVYEVDGTRIEKFFAGVNTVAKSSQAVLNVFFGKADAAVVSQIAFRTLVELNPQLEQDLHIMRTSPPVVIGLMCFRASMDERIKNRIKDIVFDVPNYPGGKQILTLFKRDVLIPFNPDYIKSLEVLLSQYQDINKG